MDEWTVLLTNTIFHNIDQSLWSLLCHQSEDFYRMIGRKISQVRLLAQVCKRILYVSVILLARL